MTTPCQGLLYLYAKQPATAPLDDELTRGMQVLLDEAKNQTGIFFKPRNTFREGVATKGWHTCCCGATSSNVDYLVAPGVATNSLCVHYLATHRDEIDAKDLALVRRLLSSSPKRTREEDKPTAEELTDLADIKRRRVQEDDPMPDAKA